MRRLERIKQMHIDICLTKDIQGKEIEPGFREVFLIHKALPELDFQEIDLSTTFLEHKFKAPILIASMTGGTKLAEKINANLAKVAQEFQIGMGVGSQKVALKSKKYVHTFKIVRKNAPTSFLIANIGATLLLENKGIEYAKKAIEMIDANALAIHLNPLQECIQIEGEKCFKGILERLHEVVDSVKTPVIVKETGAGISAEVASKLKEIGISAIDVSGAGGTSWSAIEHYRAKYLRNEIYEMLGKTFWDWGIPTVVSLIEVKERTNLSVIASGGIRTGMDIAKAIALGADLTGIAWPLLKPASQDVEALRKKLNLLMLELKTSFFLVGCKNINEIKNAPVVITGRTVQWLKARGIEVEKYAMR